MEVLRSTPLSDKAAAKLLKKFVDTKEGEENADLVMNDEVKAQLAQVLEFLQKQQEQTGAQ